MTDPLHPQQPASGTGSIPPARRELPSRRGGTAEKFQWQPSRDRGEWKTMYIRVCFHPTDWAPLEIFLRPTKHSGKWGSGLHRYAEDVGESLSRHLQDGHTLDEMSEWFKAGSLARSAVLMAQKIAREENCQVGEQSR
jgi:hypothetical protein